MRVKKPNPCSDLSSDTMPTTNGSAAHHAVIVPAIVEPLAIPRGTASNLT